MQQDIFHFAETTRQCNHATMPVELAGKLNTCLLELDRDGTLFLDMTGVFGIDQECAFLTLATLTKMIGLDLFKDKHVVVVNARPRILSILDQAVDRVNEAYLVFYPDTGKTEVRGQGFTHSLRDVYEHVEAASDAVDAASIKGMSRSAASARLNELCRLGLLVRSNTTIPRAETPTSSGRRPVAYRVFAPEPAWQRLTLDTQLGSPISS